MIKICIIKNYYITALLLALFYYPLVTLTMEQDDQRHAFLIAAGENDLATLKQLVERNGIDINTANEHGDTYLHHGYRYPDQDLLSFFLENGVNVNTQNRAGETPLHRAMVNDHFHMAEFLLKHGAQLEIVTKTGQTALHYAALKAFFSHTPGFNIFILLLAYKPKINAQDNNGDTPLHIATREYKILKNQPLYEEDYDPRYACTKPCLQDVKLKILYLVSAGARRDIRNNAGELPEMDDFEYIPFECLIQKQTPQHEILDRQLRAELEKQTAKIESIQKHD